MRKGHGSGHGSGTAPCALGSGDRVLQASGGAPVGNAVAKGAWYTHHTNRDIDKTVNFRIVPVDPCAQSHVEMGHTLPKFPSIYPLQLYNVATQPLLRNYKSA